MSEELYKRLRPQDLDQLVGQPHVVAEWGKRIEVGDIPHAICLAGPSGTGKTTLGRILRKELGCSDHDYIELNCADVRGIDNIRDIRSRMNVAPMKGKVRMYLIDEAHRLTADAQNAMLKILEDPPAHVYFMLATTDPNRLIKAIRTRCTLVEFKALSIDNLVALLRSAMMTMPLGDKTGLKELAMHIAQNAEGSARMALVMLESAMMHDTPEDRMEAVANTQTKGDAMTFARVLLSAKTWGDVAKAIADADETLRADPEGVRRCVLGYMTAIISKKRDDYAANIASAFLENFYDSGRAGVVLAAYRAFHSKK